MGWEIIKSRSWYATDPPPFPLFCARGNPLLPLQRAFPSAWGFLNHCCRSRSHVYPLPGEAASKLPLPVLAKRLTCLPILLCVSFIVKLVLCPLAWALFYKVPIECPFIGEVTAGSFQEVLKSKRKEGSCCLSKCKLGGRKHELRREWQLLPKVWWRTGSTYMTHRKDVAWLCLSHLWCKPSRAESAWAGVKPSYMCLGCLTYSSRAAGAWQCGFKSKYSLQWGDWSEKRNGVA